MALLPSSFLYAVLSCLSYASSLEVGVPERFLPPRNFNPHPYQDVVDPGGPPDLTEDPQIVPSPVSTHYLREDIPELQDNPYAFFRRPLTRGDNGRAPIQFPKVPEGANIPQQRLKPPSVKHPLNYEGVPRQQLYSPQSLKPGKKYAFSYAVLDKSSGDDFSHSQLGSGSQTKGEYRVKLPDGRLQIVSYTADHRGYHADVRYDEDNSVDSSPGITEAKFRPLPVVQHRPETPAPAVHYAHQAHQSHAFTPIRVRPAYQLHLPKPAYKTLPFDYEDTTLKPIRDHTPIHEDPEEDDLGDYQENTVSSTPSYQPQHVAQPGLIQQVSASFRGVALGERAGPVKFPPTPPPEPAQGDGRSSYSEETTPAPSYDGQQVDYSPGSTLYFTTPSPVKYFVDADGQIYSQK